MPIDKHSIHVTRPRNFALHPTHLVENPRVLDFPTSLHHAQLTDAATTPLRITITMAKEAPAKTGLTIGQNRGHVR
jgi:hypothetical protein